MPDVLDHFAGVNEFNVFQVRGSRSQLEHFFAGEALNLEFRRKIGKWIGGIDQPGLADGVGDGPDSVGPLGMVFSGQVIDEFGTGAEAEQVMGYLRKELKWCPEMAQQPGKPDG